MPNTDVEFVVAHLTAAPLTVRSNSFSRSSWWELRGRSDDVTLLLGALF
jgi:hypothetical protein